MKAQINLLLLAIVAVITFAFQNCSKVGFGEADGTLNAFKFDSFVVNTKLNTPVDFKLETDNPDMVGNGLSINIETKNKSAGTFEVVDSNRMALKFNPAFGYRGKLKATANVTDAYGNAKNIDFDVVVGNPFSSLEPAVAVRATGCITCHANIKSNFITDLGYGGEGDVHSNFLLDFDAKDVYPKFDKDGKVGRPSWLTGYYSGHGFSFHTLNMSSDKKIIAPKYEFPKELSYQINDYLKKGSYKDIWGENLFKDGFKFLSTIRSPAGFVKNIIANGVHYKGKTPPIVEGKSSIYIGAPTKPQIRSAFRVTSEKVKYYPEDDESPTLSGLLERAKIFENDKLLVCNGDLMIDGTLLLRDLKLKTKEGCRIYTTGSVFIYGPINYVFDNGETLKNQNLQITSAVSINMGLGRVTFKTDSDLTKPESYCAHKLHPGNWYYTNKKGNSFFARRTFYLNHQAFVRSANSAGSLETFWDSIVEEYENIETEISEDLLDASCKTRDVAYTRLLLNAPVVQSRYAGDISGVIVAEVPLMSLGKFSFSYDPVFSRAAILPFLDGSTILDVQQ